MLDFINQQNIILFGMIAIGILSFILQVSFLVSLKAYVKASENMKTTQKKLFTNLLRQFETIYELDYKINNVPAYVDKYLLKYKFLLKPITTWQVASLRTIGYVTCVAAAGLFWNYTKGIAGQRQVTILFTYSIVCAFLLLSQNIFGVKSKIQQIKTNLVDYLENYLVNRLERNRIEKKLAEEQRRGSGVQEDSEAELLDEVDALYFEDTNKGKKEKVSNREEMVSESDMEEDMEYLMKCLNEIAASHDSKNLEKSDEEIVEEFIRSLLG